MEQTAPQPEKTEVKPEEKVEVPPSPVPPVAALPQSVPIKPEQQTQTPPAAASTAPPRQRTASQAEVTSWQTRIVAQIERHKAYPAAAQSRGEKGVVRLTFTIDRHGRLMSSQVIASSGYPALDQESMTTLRRAQPFPPPPADLAGDKFDFNVPVSFNIR
jgi:protein TonB